MRCQLNNRPLRLQNDVYLSLFCLTGSLWLTCKNDKNDYFIHAGEHFDLNGREEIVVSALDSSAIINIQVSVVSHDGAIA